MVTAEQVRDIARRNFETLRINKPGDLAATRTPEHAKAIEDNYECALVRYLDTLIESFSTNQGSWDHLLVAATSAEADLADARARAARLPDRIRKMTKLTEVIGDLVNAARS